MLATTSIRAGGCRWPDSLLLCWATPTAPPALALPITATCRALLLEVFKLSSAYK